MAFSPEEIANKEFLPALRGYDKEEVRAFLAAVAGDYREALEGAADARMSGQTFEGLGHEVAAVLQASKDSAEKMLEQAERKVGALQDRAVAEAQRIRSESNEAARKIREEASVYAAQTKESADRNATKLLRDTQKRVELLHDTESRLRQRLMSMEALIRSMRQELAEEDDEIRDQVVDLTATEHTTKRSDAQRPTVEQDERHRADAAEDRGEESNGERSEERSGSKAGSESDTESQGSRSTSKRKKAGAAR